MGGLGGALSKEKLRKVKVANKDLFMGVGGRTDILNKGFTANSQFPDNYRSAQDSLHMDINFKLV